MAFYLLHNYMDFIKHPDNPLNFCSFPLDLDEKAYENERKLGLYSLIFAVSLFVVSFIGN